MKTAAVPFSLVGLSFVLLGTLMLYVFHDPRFGHHLMLESWNPRREKWGARIGLVLAIVGAGLQVFAVIVGAR